MSVYEFGPFQLDVERLLLLVEGQAVALGPKVVETLLALIEHPGEVLAKSALLDRIWPEGFVEEANLAQNVYVLRKTLRAHWETDAIQTVPRRGYRFAAPVRRLADVPLAQAPVVRVGRSLWPRFGAAIAAAAFVFASLVFALDRVSAHRASTSSLSENGARLYEIGRYYWNLRTRSGVGKSLTYFGQVIDSDPHDARGYAALAEANATMGNYQYGPNKPDVYFARARGYAEKALALDGNSAEAHASLGLIDLNQDHPANAIAELRQAIALDPSYGPAHEWLGIALLGRGSLADGSQQLRLAAALDPLSVSTTAWLGSAAYLDRNFNDAISYSRQVLDLSPGRTDVLTTIGEAYEAQGNYARAIAAFEQYGDSCRRCRAESAALLAHAYALNRRMPEARAELAYARAHEKLVDATDLVAAESALGERSIVMQQLRQMHGRMTWMAIQNDPRFDALRDDAAFRQLAAMQA
jgi:DNA-binding winged helix-turn-helix (wHTH) protein/Tfp pilus assembly protein PilF